MASRSGAWPASAPYLCVQGSITSARDATREICFSVGGGAVSHVADSEFAVMFAAAQNDPVEAVRALLEAEAKVSDASNQRVRCVGVDGGAGAMSNCVHNSLISAHDTIGQ
jgi:hypothetical protein